MEAWHFLLNNGRTNHGDYHVAPGGCEEQYARPRLCEWGLHGSTCLIDAMWYAPGALLRRVDISGELDICDNKIAGQVRQELWRVDFGPVMRQFALIVTSQHLAKWRNEIDPGTLIAWRIGKSAFGPHIREVARLLLAGDYHGRISASRASMWVGMAKELLDPGTSSRDLALRALDNWRSEVNQYDEHSSFERPMNDWLERQAYALMRKQEVLV